MRRALGIDEASLGPGHPNVSRDLNNLAFLLEDEGRWTVAVAFHAQAKSAITGARGSGSERGGLGKAVLAQNTHT